MKAKSNNETPEKKHYKVTNWKEYNASLVARGSVFFVGCAVLE